MTGYGQVCSMARAHEVLGGRWTLLVRFEVRGYRPRFMLLKKTEASLCHQNPGFPEPVCIRGPLATLVAWWRGDMSLVEAQRMGLALDGAKSFARAFPKWFDLYPFAHIGSAKREDQSRVRTLPARRAS